MMTNIRFGSYLAQLFLEYKMFQKKFLEKIKTHVMCNYFFIYLFFFSKMVSGVR
jgi:hypothetical protein